MNKGKRLPREPKEEARKWLLVLLHTNARRKNEAIHGDPTVQPSEDKRRHNQAQEAKIIRTMLMNARELIHLIVLVLCFAVIFGDQQGSKTALRPTHQRHQLSGSSSSAGASTSIVSSSQSITASKVNKMTTSPNSQIKRRQPWLNNFNVVVRNVQDECLDIFDALVYAESNEERMDELKDIFDRHKVTLVGGVAAVLVTKNMLAKSASYHGKNALDQMRKAEAAKWGTRLK